jgi:hypothetical protein
MARVPRFILVFLLTLLTIASGVARISGGIMTIAHEHAGGGAPSSRGHDHATHCHHHHEHVPLPVTDLPVHEHGPGTPCHVHFPVVESSAPKAERAAGPTAPSEDPGTNGPRAAPVPLTRPCMVCGVGALSPPVVGQSPTRLLRTVRIVV